MANFTLLAEGGECFAFDTGPANALLDGLARRLLDRPCDRDGEHALAGRVDEDGLAELLAHPFFEQSPPKSTGRDTFGADHVDGWLAEIPLIREYYASYGDKVPAALLAELDALEARLRAAV